MSIFIAIANVILCLSFSTMHTITSMSLRWWITPPYCIRTIIITFTFLLSNVFKHNGVCSKSKRSLTDPLCIRVYRCPSPVGGCGHDGVPWLLIRAANHSIRTRVTGIDPARWNEMHMLERQQLRCFSCFDTTTTGYQRLVHHRPQCIALLSFRRISAVLSPGWLK